MRELRDDEVEVDDSEEPTKEARIRHAQVAELAAQGLNQREIAARTNYDESTISRILQRPEVRKEVYKYRERIYQDTIASRIKQLANPALDVVEDVLNDQDHEKFAGDQRAITARWTVEQVSGKAVQRHKHDLGEDALSVFMDRLDAIKNTEKDITPGSQTPKSLAVGPQNAEEIDLKDWALKFSKSKR